MGQRLAPILTIVLTSKIETSELGLRFQKFIIVYQRVHRKRRKQRNSGLGTKISTSNGYEKVAIYSG